MINDIQALGVLAHDPYPIFKIFLSKRWPRSLMKDAIGNRPDCLSQIHTETWSVQM